MKPTKGCIERLNKEYRRLTKDPVPNVLARPDPSNILEWHFVIEGAVGTPYEGGVYHGKLLFPPDYPFKPPGIFFVTPSGRFKPYVKLCFSFSDYHPEDWNPIWHAGTILNATVSFMSAEDSTTGSVKSTAAQKKLLASQSLENSCKTPAFVRIFPEYQEKLLEARKQRLENGAENPSEENLTALDSDLEGAGNVLEEAEVAPPGEAPPPGGPPGQSLTQIAATVGVVMVAVGVVYVQYKLSPR